VPQEIGAVRMPHIRESRRRIESAHQYVLLVAGFPDHANLSVSAVVTDFLMIATEAGKI